MAKPLDVSSRRVRGGSPCFPLGPAGRHGVHEPCAPERQPVPSSSELRSLVPGALLLLAPTPDTVASLDTLTQNLLNKKQAALLKSQVKITKIEKEIAGKQTLEASLQADLAIAQAGLSAAQLAAQDAQLQLDLALAMPAGTPAEIAARKAAIAAAKKVLSAAKKQLKKAKSAAAGLTKKLGKTQAVLAKSGLLLGSLEDLVSQLESEIAQINGDFAFQTLVEIPVHIVVLDESGLPLPFVTVQIVDALILPKNKNGQLSDYILEEFVTPAVHGQGFTNSAGVIDLLIEIAGDLQLVDVVVVASGRTGPYTEPMLQQEWGPFGPAARLTQAVDDLDSVEITLVPSDS